MQRLLLVCRGCRGVAELCITVLLRDTVTKATRVLVVLIATGAAVRGERSTAHAHLDAATRLSLQTLGRRQ